MTSPITPTRPPLSSYYSRPLPQRPPSSIAGAGNPIQSPPPPLSHYSSYNHSIATSNYQSPFSRSSLPTPSISARSIRSTTTRTAPGGISKFKRSSSSKSSSKLSTPPLALVRSSDPDQLDLGSLEDPDEVFRLFGVRDVRSLEKRASDAAANKVAELRTMVGERYRDLLSAADSIVRMRAAADMLVDHFDVVESVVACVAEAAASTDSISQKGSKTANRSSFSADSTSTTTIRTLASPPTLSLTIHLLLSLPSIVHSLLDSSQFLPAARLEGIGRVVYRELCDFSYDDERGGKGVLKENFPIIERQWESIAGLGTAIVRRAGEDLKIWDTTPITTASTLASILMLENGSIPSSLNLLLSARSQSVQQILSEEEQALASHHHHHQTEIDQVLSKLKEILGLVLKTVESANEIFGASKDVERKEGGGLLHQLLTSIESPSSDSSEQTSVQPLSLFPSYTLLQKHLPNSILDFTPFLSLTSSSNLLTPLTANSIIQEWLTKQTILVVEGVEDWIANLKGGAKILARVRECIQETFLNSADNGIGGNLKKELENSIEKRLELVYKNHLNNLVERIEPCLLGLLESLKDNKNSTADTDPSYFLFDYPINFPSVGVYSNTTFIGNGTGGGGTGAGRRSSIISPPSTISNQQDPFNTFAEKIHKRVLGRSPFIDKGISEFESHASEVKVDLIDWLNLDQQNNNYSDGSLKEVYVGNARITFEEVYERLEKVLEGVVEDVKASLFLGNFIFALAGSETFAKDLLLGSFDGEREQEIKIEWESRLQTLHERSFITWRMEAVKAAIEEIEYSLKSLLVASTSPLLKLVQDQLTYSNQQPTSGVLGALRILVTSIRHAGPHRTQSNPKILNGLMSEFRSKSLTVYNEVDLEQLGEEVASKLAWDVRFLSLFWDGGEEEWRSLEGIFLGLSSGQTDPTMLESSTLHYLQRTQIIFAPLLTQSPPPSKSSQPSQARSKLLAWGTAPAGLEFRSFGSLIPGARLGLLPTR